MVSSETARIGIIKRAKNPQKPPMIRYKDAKPAICAYLADAGRSVNPLVAAEALFNQRKNDQSQGPLIRDDAIHSIEVLNAIQAMSNKLKSFDFHLAPNRQNKLNLAGLDVSVYSDLLVFGSNKGKDIIGSAILRMTQDDADSESAKVKRREMGLCVATLARFHTAQNIGSDREVANRLCMSIDVQHGEVFIAPDANSQRMNNIENACRFIVALWPTV